MNAKTLFIGSAVLMICGLLFDAAYMADGLVLAWIGMSVIDSRS